MIRPKPIKIKRDMMQVDFYGTYRLIAGQKMLEVIQPQENTVIGLLHILVEKFPAFRDEILDENGYLLPYIPLYLNGRNPRLLKYGLQTVVGVDDVVSLFSPISSGHINVEDVKKMIHKDQQEIEG